jgi:RNA polymerase sigma factor (sigma-70 family)
MRSDSNQRRRISAHTTDHLGHSLPDSFSYWIHLAEREGQRYGLTLEDAQDCAMDLIVRLVLWKSQNVMSEGEESDHVPFASSEVTSIPSEAWFAHCAKNAALGVHRKQRRREEIFMMLPPSSISTDPVEIVLERCAERHIEELLLHLDEEPRLVFTRCYLIGDSISEVATSLGKTPNAIRLVLTRCRRRLRALLTPQDEATCKGDVAPRKNNLKKSDLTRHD